MIDLFRLQIPISEDFVTEVVDKTTGRTSGGLFDITIAHKYGCKLASGEVEIGEGGTVTHQLYHPFESIPSSNGSLSFKVRSGGDNYWPFIEVQASPAKLLQGHNVYGSTDVEKCVLALFDAFIFEFPDIVTILDIKNATIVQMDCTFSAHVENHFVAKQVIDALRHVSSGQVRATNQSFETTVLWNAGSRHCTREVYLKHFEVLRQIERLEAEYKRRPHDYIQRQLTQLNSTDVQLFARNAVRFEAKCKKRFLERLGIPLKIFDFINYAHKFDGCLIEKLWQEAFKEIFNTFEGHHVNIYNDQEVLDKLKSQFHTINKSGTVSYAKAKRLFRFFRSLKAEGWSGVKSTTAEKTFYRNIAELTTVVPKAYLQNLHSVKTNIIPLIKLVNVDFSNQRPASYVEPLSMVEQLTGKAIPLRLAS